LVSPGGWQAPVQQYVSPWQSLLLTQSPSSKTHTPLAQILPLPHIAFTVQELPTVPAPVMMARWSQRSSVRRFGSGFAVGGFRPATRSHAGEKGDGYGNALLGDDDHHASFDALVDSGLRASGENEQSACPVAAASYESLRPPKGMGSAETGSRRSYRDVVTIGKAAPCSVLTRS
jgi:hypothetical protein